jgi:hypothetical protein
VNSLNTDGMVPVSLLSKSRRSTSFTIFPKVVGSRPVNLFSLCEKQNEKTGVGLSRSTTSRIRHERELIPDTIAEGFEVFRSFLE